MKSSPLIDISLSAVSTAIITALYNYGPDDTKFLVTSVPMTLMIITIGLRYLAAYFQISDYKTVAATGKLKKHKKYLLSCINDKNLSKQAREGFQQEYENVTSAINMLHRD